MATVVLNSPNFDFSSFAFRVDFPSVELLDEFSLVGDLEFLRKFFSDNQLIRLCRLCHVTPTYGKNFCGKFVDRDTTVADIAQAYQITDYIIVDIH